jgi:hypothetical protein
VHNPACFTVHFAFSCPGLPRWAPRHIGVQSSQPFTPAVPSPLVVQTRKSPESVATVMLDCGLVSSQPVRVRGARKLHFIGSVRLCPLVTSALKLCSHHRLILSCANSTSFLLSYRSFALLASSKSLRGCFIIGSAVSRVLLISWGSFHFQANASRA